MKALASQKDLFVMRPDGQAFAKLLGTSNLRVLVDGEDVTERSFGFDTEGGYVILGFSRERGGEVVKVTVWDVDETSPFNVRTEVRFGKIEVLYRFYPEGEFIPIRVVFTQEEVQTLTKEDCCRAAWGEAQSAAQRWGMDAETFVTAMEEGARRREQAAI